MAGRKTFTAGEVLQAADVNDYLMDQSVMVFAGTAARGSAIPSPTEGMVTYLKDTDALEKRTASAWVNVNTDSGKILQVVSATKTDTASISIAAGAISSAVTGLSVSITPSSASSKVMVFSEVSLSASSVAITLETALYRNGTAVGVGDASGSRARVSSGAVLTELAGLQNLAAFVLDSPATTSSVTYDIRLHHGSGSTRTVHVNRSDTDTNSNVRARTASTITVMEVAG